MIIDAALYEDGRRVAGELDLPEMVERGRNNPDAFVWIGLFEPGDAEFEDISRVFALHPLAVGTPSMHTSVPSSNATATPGSWS